MSKLKVYLPSWVIPDFDKSDFKLNPTNVSGNAYAVDAFTAYRVTTSIPYNLPKVCDIISLAEHQYNDTYLCKIIKALATNGKNNNINVADVLDKEDHRTAIYNKLIDSFYLEPGSMVLLLKQSSERIQLVVPQSLRPSFLHKAHDQINHSGIVRVKSHLAQFWWEHKDNDIKAYIDSCVTCARRKGNYGRPPKWNIGHCRRGTRPFEIIYLDFVTMPVSKGKRYILTILDSFSRHLMAIPCAHDRAIDAARGLYQLFLRHRERPEIVSSDRGTHFTGEVYKNFCDSMSIQQELHCPWRPQSSGNIERQHRTMKNALFMLCEDRKCEWTDVIEAVISNMNSTINSDIGVCPHYVITGRHPNLGLPRNQSRQIRHPDPASYGMQINKHMRQVHRLVEIANKEFDIKLERQWSNGIPREPLQQGDKVLIYRPQSVKAKSTHLPWIGDFTIVKGNGRVFKVIGDNDELSWVHVAHIRHVPDRPEHLSRRLIPFPVTATTTITASSPSSTLNAAHSTPEPPRDSMTHSPGNLPILPDQCSPIVCSSRTELPRTNLIQDQIISQNVRRYPTRSNRQLPAKLRSGDYMLK